MTPETLLSWQSFDEVSLALNAREMVPVRGPLSAHEDWLNKGGALRKVGGLTDGAVLVVHQTLRAVAVLWGKSWVEPGSMSMWSSVIGSPYLVFVDLGWGNPTSVFERVPTPVEARETLPLRYVSVRDPHTGDYETLPIRLDSV